MKPFEGFTAETIDFLWELRMNNSREWMEENRDRYKRVLKEPFDSLAAALVAESMAFGGREMKCSVSRINRDIRFSKDKSPSFYFELNPEGYEHGLGMWCSPSAFLAAYRRKIESNPAAFERMAKKFEKDPLFRLEWRAYKKFKNETLSPLLQAWYPKKDVLLVAHGGMEDILFSPELPQFLAEGWSRLKNFYAFLDAIEAE